MSVVIRTLSVYCGSWSCMLCIN